MSKSIEQLAKEIAMFKDDCVEPEDMLIDYDNVRVGDVYKLIQEAIEEERKNVPVGFLRQFINERTTEEHKNLLTNEDIMRFIKLGYKTPLTDKDV